MKRLGRAFLACSLAYCVLMFAVAPGPVTAQPGEANVIFRWAFGACLKSTRKLVAIKRGTTLKSGDEIQMLLELQTKSYVYVIYRSPQGEVILLFPYHLQQYDTEPVVEPEPYLNRYYIPQDRSWIELDEQVGRETFYLLASARRLTKLEGFIAAYEAAGPAEQAARAKQIVVEVNRVRRSYRTFATLAQRPVPIQGRVRSVRSRCPNIGKYRREVSAQNFYGRTFTFDHQ